MRIDHAGHEGRVAEVDDPGTRRDLEVGPRLDLVVVHYHHTVIRELAGHGIEQMSSLQHHGAGGWVSASARGASPMRPQIRETERERCLTRAPRFFRNICRWLDAGTTCLIVMPALSIT